MISNEIKLREKSCGCVIIEDGKVLLIQQTKGHWGLPKGHVEEGETEEETAIREVKEETNLDVEIIDGKRYVTEYPTDKGTIKEVVFFVGKKVGGEVEKQEEEVSKIEWLEFSDAIEKVTYEDTKMLLKQIVADLNK